MNKKYFLFILAAAGVVLTSFFLIPKSRQRQLPEISPTPGEDIQNVTLVIDRGDGNPKSFTVETDPDSTAFSLLKTVTEKENIALDTQQYDFGIFVKSIDGLEGSTEMAWIYYVNGESGQVAADQMNVKGSDTVEWRYTKPE